MCRQTGPPKSTYEKKTGCMWVNKRRLGLMIPLYRFIFEDRGTQMLKDVKDKNNKIFFSFFHFRKMKNNSDFFLSIYHWVTPVVLRELYDEYHRKSALQKKKTKTM